MAEFAREWRGVHAGERGMGVVGSTHALRRFGRILDAQLVVVVVVASVDRAIVGAAAQEGNGAQCVARGVYPRRIRC